MLNQIDADVCVLQEAYKLTVVDNVRGRRADPTPIVWTGRFVKGENAQSNYFYAFKDGVKYHYHFVQDDPRGNDVINGGRKYLILKFSSGGESVRLATFHAPFQMNKEDKADKNITAYEYLRDLLSTDGRYKHTGPRKHPERQQAEWKNVDLIMADTNVYCNTETDKLCRPTNYRCVLNSPTTRGAKSGNLDRIFVRNGAFPNHRCGRVIFPNYKGGSLSSLDQTGKAEDMILPDDFSDDWGNSDHVPIYFDTDSTKHRLPMDSYGVIPMDSDSEEKEEFQMLDYRGRGEKAMRQKNQDHSNL
jgi:hypothetical protein